VHEDADPSHVLQLVSQVLHRPVVRFMKLVVGQPQTPVTGVVPVLQVEQLLLESPVQVAQVT
jgi:hypothetical protein